jgi:predicted Zn-dependent peptidase
LFAYLQKTVKDTSERENEIYQLAFRAAKKSKTSKVYGIDVNMVLPFDSMMVAIEKAGQIALKNEIYGRLKILETEENARRKKFILTQLLLMNNTPEYRKANYSAYVTLFNRAGALNNFKGADVVNIWYKRNLYMYSLVQKLTESKDKRVVVVLGSGHIALFK